MPKCDFIEITLWHVCFPVKLLDIFITPFVKNTSGWLLQIVQSPTYNVNGGDLKKVVNQIKNKELE